jgi:uncharacterized protein
MFSGPAFERTLQDIQTGVDRCRLSCPYFALCGGGAPANKLFENGSFASTETLYCRLGKKAVIDTVLGSIEYELREQAQAARNSDKSESCQPVAQCG